MVENMLKVLMFFAIDAAVLFALYKLGILLGLPFPYGITYVDVAYMYLGLQLLYTMLNTRR